MSSNDNQEKMDLIENVQINQMDHDTMENPVRKSNEYNEKSGGKHNTASATLATDHRIMSDRDIVVEEQKNKINDFNAMDEVESPVKEADEESLQFDQDEPSPTKDDTKFKWNPHINPNNTSVHAGMIEDSMEIHLLNGEGKSKRNIPKNTGDFKHMLNDSIHYQPTKEEYFSNKKDRMEDLKLPDINTSRADDIRLSEQSKSIGVSTLDKREEEAKTSLIKTSSGNVNKDILDPNHIKGLSPDQLEEYTDEQKAKIQQILSLFNQKESKHQRQKAKNDKIKQMGNQMMEKQTVKQVLEDAAYDFKFGEKPNQVKKFVVYDKRSCYCLKKGTLIRDSMVKLICWPMFDNFIVMMILVNSIFMGIYDYNDRDNQEKNNQVIEMANYIFSKIFTVEAIVKIMAMGFYQHKNSYLRDPWNWLDFTVVLTAVIEDLKFDFVNVNSLKILRVLRPLRSINAFPSMKRLISSLLASLPQLGTAVVFMFFIFLLFMIFGVQSFSGLLYQRCRTQATPEFEMVGDKKVYTHWPIDEDDEQLCSLPLGGGQHMCAEGRFCGSPEKFNISRFDDGVQDSELVMYGIITFDNVIDGLITIFQVITLEGWSTLMYNLSDASPQWLAEIFCIMLVLVGSFFLLNVILAVIMDAFDDVDASQSIIEKKQKAELKQLRADYGFSSSESEEDNENELNDDVSNPDIKIQKDMEKKQNDNINQILPVEIDPLTGDCSPNKKGDQTPKSSSKRKSQLLELPERAKSFVIYKWFFILVSQNMFNVFITLCIVLNTVLLAMDKYPIHKEEYEMQQMFNNILSWIFFGEMILKLIGLGFKEYAQDSFNLFDCTVVCISLVENIIDWVGVSFSGGGAISALRAIRLLRVFKLARSWTSFRELLHKIIITLKDITNISVLMLLFMFIFALVGSEMYGYKVKYIDEDLSSVIQPGEEGWEEGIHPRQNFNTLGQGLTTIFIVLIGEDWNSVMYDHYRSTRSPVAVVFFILIFIFGNLILLNLFLAILLKNFEEPPGQDEEEVFEEFETKQESKMQKVLKFVCFCFFSKKEEEKETELVDSFALKTSKLQQANEKNNKDQLSEESEGEKSLEISQKPASKKRRGTGFVSSASADEQQKFGQMFEKKDQNPNGLKKSKTMSSSMLIYESNAQKKRDFSISTIKLRQVIGKESEKVLDPLHGTSCWVLSETNQFRLKCSSIVKHKHFDNFVLFLILFSTILLAIEDPYEKPGTTKVAVLEKLDMILSFTFLLELLIKVVVMGFALNGEGSYMRNAWNIMDFIIVFFSMVSIVFQDVDLGPIKVLRMLRVLRPLRMISRNPGMKIAIQSLINAIPDIGNVMVVSLLFILLFAILGTNFYKGTFYKCNMDNIPEQFQDKILDKYDCMDYGGDWVNEDQNFDNIKSSLITLFNVMTTEGWIGVMWNAVDSTQINQMPVKNNGMLQILFFMLYMIACSLFVLNMFVGIVINVFNREKDTLYMNHKFTETQIDWCESMIYVYQQKPYIKYKPGDDRIKDIMHSIATNTVFDTFIFLCIIFNTICLTLTWYNEPAELSYYLEQINLVFNIIYTVEATIKMVAFRSDYFKDGWNSFDFIIVVSAWLGFLADKLKLEIGDFDKLTGSLRISRIFKIVKKYKSLRILLSTFIGAIQQLTNVGGLLFLFLFLYSVLGVFTFAGVKHQDAINQHANFTNFHMALITLFRMATGESWHELMFDCSRQKSITFDCQTTKQTYEQIQEFGRQECGSELAAYMYFISFMIVVSFIFLNLFIAIILESFNSTQVEEGLKVGAKTMAIFNDLWTEFDPKGTSLILIDDLRLLITRIIEEESKLIINARQRVQDGELENYDFEQMTFMFELYKNDYLSLLSSIKQNEIQAKDRGSDQDENEIYEEHKDSKDIKTSSVSKIIVEGKIASSDGGTQSIVRAESDNEEVRCENRSQKSEQQIMIDKWMSTFIGSLRCPCYGTIKYYYYYDIVEALSRDMFQRQLLEKQAELIAEELKQEKALEEARKETEGSQKVKDEIEEGVVHQYLKKEHLEQMKHAEPPLITTKFPYGDGPFGPSKPEEQQDVVESEKLSVQSKKEVNLIHPGRSQTKLEKLIMDQVDDIWELYDTDLSGVLNKDQTRRFVQDTLKHLRPEDKFSEDAFAEVFKQFDKDNSGNVEKKEMFYFIKHLMIGFDMEEMEKEDIRIAELEVILERLEEVGHDYNVQKYQLMLELRNARINQMKKQLDIHNTKNIIDSSQVQAAFLIHKWYRGLKQKRAIKRIREASRQSLSLESNARLEEKKRQSNQNTVREANSQRSIEFDANINEMSTEIKQRNEFVASSFDHEISQPTTNKVELQSSLQKDIHMTQSVAYKVPVFGSDGPSVKQKQKNKLPEITEAITEEAGDKDEARDTTNMSGAIGHSGGQGPFFNGQSTGQISNSPRFEGEERQHVAGSSKSSYHRDSGPGNKQGEGAFAEEGKDPYNTPLVITSMDFTEGGFPQNPGPQ